MTTIIVTDGKKTQKVEQSDFVHEGSLQQYISDNPECLPIYDIDDDAKLMIIGREFHTDHGPIDVLGIDASGNIYIIETKLYKNPDKRKVIAQLFDYGASLWNGYDTDDFISAIDQHLQQTGHPLIDALSAEFDFDDEDGAADTVAAIKKNLQDGRFRFIVLMDHIDERLKTLISFINSNSRFDVFAVELKYYKHSQGEVLIPELFGERIKKPDQKSLSSAGGVKCNAGDFFADAKNQLRPDELEAVEDLHGYSADRSERIEWEENKGAVEFLPKFREVRIKNLDWWSPYTVSTRGTLHLRFFCTSKTKDGREMGRLVREALASQGVEGINANNKGMADLPVSEWKGQLNKITSAMDDALKQIKEYRSTRPQEVRLTVKRFLQDVREDLQKPFRKGIEEWQSVVGEPRPKNTGLIFETQHLRSKNKEVFACEVYQMTLIRTKDFSRWCDDASLYENYRHTVSEVKEASEILKEEKQWISLEGKEISGEDVLVLLRAATKLVQQIIALPSNGKEGL